MATVGYPSRASEFPNDNEEISTGARWSSELVTGAVEAQLPVEAPRATSHQPVVSEPFVLFFDDDEPLLDAPVEVVLGARGPVLVVSEARPEPEAPPALRRFERALEQSLMARGASRAAALVPRLLRLQPLPADALAEDLHRSLRDGGYLDEAGRYLPRFQERWGAWSAVLSGSSEDLSACGATTLDSFGGELLAALLAVPRGRAEELRRELRKAGIAAFGVLDAA